MDIYTHVKPSVKKGAISFTVRQVHRFINDNRKLNLLMSLLVLLTYSLINVC